MAAMNLARARAMAAKAFAQQRLTPEQVAEDLASARLLDADRLAGIAFGGAPQSEEARGRILASAREQQDLARRSLVIYEAQAWLHAATLARIAITQWGAIIARMEGRR